MRGMLESGGRSGPPPKPLCAGAPISYRSSTSQLKVRAMIGSDVREIRVRGRRHIAATVAAIDAILDRRFWYDKYFYSSSHPAPPQSFNPLDERR